MLLFKVQEKIDFSFGGYSKKSSNQRIVLFLYWRVYVYQCLCVYLILGFNCFCEEKKKKLSCVVLTPTKHLCGGYPGWANGLEG